MKEKVLVEVCLRGEAPERFLQVFPKAEIRVDASGGKLSPAIPKIQLQQRGINSDYWITYFPDSERLELFMRVQKSKPTDRDPYPDTIQNCILLNELNVRLVSYIKHLSQFKLTDKLKRQIKTLCLKELDDREFQKQLNTLLMLNLL